MVCWIRTRSCMRSTRLALCYLAGLVFSSGSEVQADEVSMEDSATSLNLVATASPPSPYFPTFDELHQRLFNVKVEDNDNNTHVILSFSNPYRIRPNFNSYPHANLLPEFFCDLLDGIVREGGPRFVVEVGSLHGHSSVQMATVLDRLGFREVPILCIDPFTGDTNMWANYQTDRSVAGWTQIRDGRMMVFDQFMVNVQFALTRTLSRRHILPFHATSTVGARWMKQLGYTPDVIFLDSAHEEGETFLEISMYYELLLPGGILFGDDYGWAGVRNDVHRFVNAHNAKHAVDAPADLRIVRAKEGTDGNLMWIVRKAKV